MKIKDLVKLIKVEDLTNWAGETIAEAEGFTCEDLVHAVLNRLHELILDNGIKGIFAFEKKARIIIYPTGSLFVEKYEIPVKIKKSEVKNTKMPQNTYFTLKELIVECDDDYTFEDLILKFTIDKANIAKQNNESKNNFLELLKKQNLSVSDFNKLYHEFTELHPDSKSEILQQD